MKIVDGKSVAKVILINQQNDWKKFVSIFANHKFIFLSNHHNQIPLNWLIAISILFMRSISQNNENIGRESLLLCKENVSHQKSIYFFCQSSCHCFMPFSVSIRVTIFGRHVRRTHTTKNILLPLTLSRHYDILYMSVACQPTDI